MAAYALDTPASRTRPRLLIVEDDPTVRELCRLLLRQSYEISSAENGRIGLELLRRERFDLVLTDLQMPEMDGMELLRRMREEHLDADAIILTAHATVETAKQALRLGALDYLAKPIDPPDNLERTVRTCLELRRMRKEKERLSDLVVMYQFSQVIATSLDNEAQVEQIASFLWDRFSPETLSVSLVYPEDEELVLLLYKVRTSDAVFLERVKIADCCADDVLIRSHIELLGNVQPPDSALTAGTVLRTHDRSIGYLFLTRNADQPPFDASERKLLSVFASQIAASLDNARLYQQLKEQSWQTIEALAEAIDARDTYTYGHSKQVTRYAVRLAEVLGLPPERIELLRYAGLLHDIGKIGVRDHILLKPGQLSPEEAATMREHPLIGGRIISKVRGLQAAVPIVEAHHEQVDGRGYPNGMGAEDLPVEARILAIADAYEAMTADRAYRAAMESEKALRILLDGRGTKWDEAFVDTFVNLIRTEGDLLLPAQRLRQAPLEVAHGAVC